MKIHRIVLEGFRRFNLSIKGKIDITFENKLILIIGPNGSGKAQPLDAFIKVPNGWQLMGNLKVGDIITAKDGSPTKVTGVFPQGKQEIFKFTFADGRTAEATGDHLWKVYIGGKKYPIVPTIMTTLQIINTLSSKTYGHLIWIDLIEPETSETRDDIKLPINPYLLGVILGDGCIRGTINITNPDEFIYHKLKTTLEGSLTVNKTRSNSSGCLTYGIGHNYHAGPNSNYIINYFKECGLMWKRSHEKFIPDIFLFGSSKQRLELLQGLMDTDGTCDLKGTSSYSTSSYQLATNVVYLIRSLGGIAYISQKFPTFTYKGMKRKGLINYQVNIRYPKPSDLFTLPKKKVRTNDNNQYAATLKLRIENIESIGYKEAQCISIDHPDKLYITDNFVVTHNTSLMKELSPLPANANDFNKNGKKYVEIEFNNSFYKLTSSFVNGSSSFSFLKDDVELNPGGTVTVYKELVFKFFNLDTTTFNLLSNETSFIFFSNQERKNWITRISDNDLTYAISYYNKNKELLRDTQGSVKLAKTKLLQETDKLMDSKQYEELKFLISDSHNLLDKLLALRDNKQIDPLELKSQIVALESKITSYTDKLNTYVNEYPKIEQYSTQAKLDEEFINTQTSINTLTIQISKDEEQLKTILGNIETLKKADIDSKEDIQAKLAQANTNIVTLNSQLKHHLEFNNPSEALNSYLTVYDNIQDIFINLIPNPEQLYTKDYYIVNLEKYNKLISHINLLENTYKSYLVTKQELETRKKESQVECPKCSYNWYINYSEEQYSKVLKDIDLIYKDLEEAKVKSKSLEDHLNIVKTYLGYLNSYRSIVNNWFMLKPIWNILESDPLFYSNPKSLLPVLEEIKKDLITSIELKKYIDNKKELETVLSMLEKDTECSLQNMINISEKLESAYYISTQKVIRLKKHIEYIKQLKETLSTIDAIRKALEGYLEAYTENMNLGISYKRKCAIDDIIKSIKFFISDKENLLSKQTIQYSIVENITKTIAEQEELLIYYKAIEKTLSPTEGLIAKSLTGFINTFILHNNNFIKKIWSYPLELVTIEPDENLDINYKFKVLVNEVMNIPDIVRLSSAQKEIVDLAVRIVSMLYLNMLNYPLYLDEFAAKMDSVHRKAAFYTISNLLLNSNFSQIFLINHYEDQYGSLKNAQIIDLSTI